MTRWLVVLLVTVTLVGCASSGRNTTALTEEQFLELSANNARLIELYKNRLRNEENVSTRLKLAKAYLDSNDNESTLFTISPLIKKDLGGSEAFYLQGVAQYNVGRLRQAEKSLQIAINKDDDSAKAINMLGVVYAELGNLSGARTQFNQAREMMYDDLAIKNNLALLDMLEGKYQDAAVRLMPIYLKNPKKADPQLKANLAIILSKMGSFETLRRVYGEQYSDAQLFDIFNDLKASMPVSRVYGPKAINPLMQEPVNIEEGAKQSSAKDPASSKSSTEKVSRNTKTSSVARVDTSPSAPIPSLSKQTVAQTEQEEEGGFFSWLFSKKKPKKIHNFVKLNPYSLTLEGGYNIPIAPLRTLPVTEKTAPEKALAQDER